MPDHINISDPTSVYNRLSWEHRLERETAKAALAHAQMERDHWRDNLEAVFTRARKGQSFWLTDDKGHRIICGPLPDPDASED